MNRLLSELRRRNVFRVAAAYLVAAWLIMQVVSVLAPALALPGWVDSFFAVIVIAGFPIALILAWAFELTPEGMKLTEAVPRDASITAKTGRKLDFIILVTLVMLTALIVWQQFSRAPADAVGSLPAVEAETRLPVVAETAEDEEEDVASIAVLPFDDMSPGGDQQYFSDGISEEILNVLTRVEGLSITSRTSAFQYRDSSLGIPAIARELDVRHILEGSVRRDGDHLRVTAQLIDARADRHIWSQTYDRPLSAGAVFEIQDEIASAIVDALSTTLGTKSTKVVNVPPSTSEVSAYDRFLRARSLIRARMQLDVADELLTQALEDDDSFAGAWSLRAAANSLMNDYGYTHISREQAQADALEYANRALELDPTNATAFAVRAKIRMNANTALRDQYDWADILDDYKSALSRDPDNTETLNWQGQALTSLGYTEDARRAFQHCTEADSRYAPCRANLCNNLAQTGTPDEALACYRDAMVDGLIRQPDTFLVLLAQADEELAFLGASNHPGVLPGWDQHDALYIAYAEPGEDHPALAAALEAHLSERDDISPYLMSSLLLPLGRVQETLYVDWGPGHQRYRQSGVFKAYMENTGILTHWRSHGFPPQCRALPAEDGSEADFTCD